MTEETVVIQENNSLQWMTLAMKSFKIILQQLQSQYRCIYFQNNSNQSYQIQELMNNLQKSARFIDEVQRRKMLNNRLINRFIQITTIYRNKCSQSQATLKLRDHLYSLLIIIKEHQANFNQKMKNQTINNYDQKLSLSCLFDKICFMFRKVIKQVKQMTQRTNNTGINISLSKCFVSPTSQNTINQQKQKQKQRRTSFSQASPNKSLQYKYKLTKQIIGNASILVGMDIDLTHLRGFFYQAKNNLTQMNQDRLQANQAIKKCRDKYSDMYDAWKTRVKRRNSKKQKTSTRGQTSPPKINSNSQNKATGTFQNNLNLMSTITANKMPKLMQSSLYNSNIYEQGRKRVQFKNMQALTFNRQFIHLSEIKNQKLARRPYAQVKQVLVAGDQLNYYSNKYQAAQNSYIQPSKASFFMQRAAKNQKTCIRKKSSYIENCRIATEE